MTSACQGIAGAQPWLPVFAKITAVTDETPGVRTYDLEIPPDHGDYRFRAGQFNMLYLPGIGEAAISMSSDPLEAPRIRHTIRTVGNVTGAMERLGPGDMLGVRGPFGSAWPVEQCAGRDLVSVAGGIGLAPLRPALYQIAREREKYGKVDLLIGARTPKDLLYTDEYAGWRKLGIEVVATVDAAGEDWQGPVGVVTIPLASLPCDPKRVSVFTCGPDIMMRHVAAGALRRGVPGEQVFVSLERNMNCAVGLCGHCQFGPEFLCKDGPVFPYPKVGALMLVEDF